MYTNYYNNQSPNTYLIHYGVKGMKWGVRHDIDKAGYSRSKVYSNLEKTKQNYKDSKSEYGRSSEKTIKARSQYKNAKKEYNKRKKQIGKTEISKGEKEEGKLWWPTFIANEDYTNIRADYNISQEKARKLANKYKYKKAALIVPVDIAAKMGVLIATSIMGKKVTDRMAKKYVLKKYVLKK